jgi:hypothetical protein
VYAGRLFGLDVLSEVPLSNCVIPATGAARPRTTLRAAHEEEIDAALRPVGRRTVLERYRIEGGLGLGVYALDGGEYLIDAPGHGRYLVAADGSDVRCAVDGLPAVNWQRALLAQVVPLAATLRGMELIHSSAVALGGGAYAFSGPSGAGKSSIAAHLVGLGATPLTDDVLALEATPFGLHAHAGPRRANVFDKELQAIPSSRRHRLGPRVAQLDKVQLDLPVASDTPPLRRLHLLERGAEVAEFEVEEFDAPDPMLLIGAAFVPYVTGADRLRKQLDICADLASKVRVFRVRIPLTTPASHVARRIAEEALADGERG